MKQEQHEAAILISDEGSSPSFQRERRQLNETKQEQRQLTKKKTFFSLRLCSERELAKCEVADEHFKIEEQHITEAPARREGEGEGERGLQVVRCRSSIRHSKARR